MHSVPYPESHILCDEERLVGDSLVFHVEGDVDKTRKDLVHGVVWCPYAYLVVVRGITLDEHAVSRRDGVDIAVAIVLHILLVLVEILPGTAHRNDFLLWSIVTGLTVTAEAFIPHESHLLHLPELVDHQADSIHQLSLDLRVGRTCICKRQG